MLSRLNLLTWWEIISYDTHLIFIPIKSVSLVLLAINLTFIFLFFLWFFHVPISSLSCLIYSKFSGREIIFHFQLISLIFALAKFRCFNSLFGFSILRKFNLLIFRIFIGIIPSFLYFWITQLVQITYYQKSCSTLSSVNCWIIPLYFDWFTTLFVYLNYSFITLTAF